MKVGDLILKSLVVGFRVLGEVDNILTNPYQYTHGLPFSEKQVSGSVRRLVRRGFLSRNGRGDKAAYRLTARGQQRVRERMSRFILEPLVWDGKWRMVIFDIEETQHKTRNRLRWFLKSLGFGRLQLSIWISPFPVREILEEFLAQSGLGKAALVAEADYVSGWDSQELASRVWGNSALAERYRRFTLQCEQAEWATAELREEFATLVKADPFLPEGLCSYALDRTRALRSYNTLIKKEMSLSMRRSNINKNIVKGGKS